MLKTQEDIINIIKNESYVKDCVVEYSCSKKDCFDIYVKISLLDFVFRRKVLKKTITEIIAPRISFIISYNIYIKLICNFTYMKKLLLLLSLSLLPLLSLSQSGWNSGEYYAYQGQTVEECGYAYAKYDYLGNFIGNYVTCRTLSWETTTYSGYINYWNYQTGQWYSEWRSGSYWYCYWSGWYEKRVW